MILLLLLLPWLLLASDALLCWQALLRCHQEPGCELAYGQYVAACEGNIRGTRSQCPSHCIGALIRLNRTRAGPPLETCDCAQDLRCLSGRRAIQPCLPHLHPSDALGVGCTEARQSCEEDGRCGASLSAYLDHCGQLFSGRKCSSRCKSTIQQMLQLPGGVLLQRCVCDGVERPFCEGLKENMRQLCFTGDNLVLSQLPDVEDVYEDEDYESPGDQEEEGDARPSSAAHRSPGYMMLLLGPLAWRP